MENYLLSPMGLPQLLSLPLGTQTKITPFNAGDLFLKLSELLDRGLATANKITSDVRAESGL